MSAETATAAASQQEEEGEPQQQPPHASARREYHNKAERERTKKINSSIQVRTSAHVFAWP